MCWSITALRPSPKARRSARRASSITSLSPAAGGSTTKPGSAGAERLIWSCISPRWISPLRAGPWPMNSGRLQQVSPTFPFLAVREASPHPEKKSFEELAAIYAVRDDSNWPIARAYLIETSARSIRPSWTNCTPCGSIYANDHRPNPSLVFLHRDPHGKVRGATLRDTRQQSAFRPCLGNKLTAWFAVGNFANADRIVAVESPIDALSYYSLFASRHDALAIVSCAGSTVPHELMFQAYDRRQSFVVALDNDAAGERGWRRRGMTPWIGRDSGSRRNARHTRIGTTTWFMSPANSRGSPLRVFRSLPALVLMGATEGEDALTKPSLRL